MAKKINIKSILIKILFFFPWVFILIIFLCIYIWIYAPIEKDLYKIKKDLEDPSTSLASIIYSSDSKVMGKFYSKNRVNIHFNDLSPYLVDALESTEDERFRQHSGIDVRAISRAVWGQITFNPKGGGSTITMQLAKNLFTDDPSRGFSERILQKVREGVITPMLERSYTKDEIITMYFNTLDFVNNAVGVNSAAKIYFNKKPKELNLQESAMLVGMAKNPSLFNPLRFPENARDRRNVVLKQMLKNKKIQQQDYDTAKETPLGIVHTKEDHNQGIAPYFRQELKKTVKEILKGTGHNIYTDGLKIYTTIDSRLQKHAENAVYTHLGTYLQKEFDDKNYNRKRKYPPFQIGDKQFETTVQGAKNIINKSIRDTDFYRKLIGKLCRKCGRASVKVLDENYCCSHKDCEFKTPKLTEKQIEDSIHHPSKVKVFDWGSPNYEKDTILSPYELMRYNKGILRAGLMSMDPSNGHIKAWVGGPNFKYFQQDMVSNKSRQVGSTFKPFVYATAIELGVIEPCTEFPDIKYSVVVPYNKNHGTTWTPEGHTFTGAPMPTYFALANSMNNIMAQIIDKGSMINSVYSRLPQLGIDTGRNDLQPRPSMALGTFNLSLFEMVGATSAFANEGVYTKPVSVTRIEDKQGRVIYSAYPKIQQVWNKETAYTMLEMMKLVTKGVKHPTLKNSKGEAVRAGTAARIRWESKSRPYAGLTQPIAGKTGTTQNNADGWFMGLTPDLVTGVWVGAENQQVHFSSTFLGQGANTALPIFAYYTKFVNSDETLNVSQGDFEMPETIIISPLDCINEVKKIEVINEEGWGEDLENEKW